MQAELCEAIGLHVRYNSLDENGESRSDRNENFDVDSPHVSVPEHAEYLWEWFFEMSAGIVRSGSEGVCRNAPWSEMLAWQKAFGHIVWPEEYAILRAMDAEFCRARDEEHAEYMKRLSEKRK